MPTILLELLVIWEGFKPLHTLTPPAGGERVQSLEKVDFIHFIFEFLEFGIYYDYVEGLPN
jgi:hypothetical protein